MSCALFAYLCHMDGGDSFTLLHQSTGGSDTMRYAQMCQNISVQANKDVCKQFW